jgi:hypothetical protein
MYKLKDMDMVETKFVILVVLSLFTLNFLKHTFFLKTADECHLESMCPSISSLILHHLYPGLPAK